jgi:hypothetical protein
MAVGGTSGAASAQSLAEQWNGLGWMALPTPLLNKNKDLAAVACPRANLCQAVGTIGAERWNGSTWAVEKTPASVLAPVFSSVSCPAGSFCLAVGQRGTKSAAVTLAETWNGTTWSVHNPVNPAAAAQASLSSVWCVSATDCLAVGTYETPSSNLVAFSEFWNGSAWSLDTVPAATSLSGIACASPTSCIAVGINAPHPLALSWNGTRWTVLPAPPSAATAIWCTAASNCMAVGGSSAESWNGSTWTSLVVPSLSASLNSVSCATASSCVAVGTAKDSGSFSMAWNGSRWLPHRVNQRDQFSGVACTLAIRCMAAGGYLTPSATGATLAASWNGSGWRQRATASPPGSALSDVSCVSASDCMAVGSINGSSTLAELWNGSTWRVTKTPARPAGSQEYGVSCKGSQCLAVGRSMLAELWNGSGWQVEKLPLPSPFYSGELTDVSCATASYCLVTGFYFTAVQSNSSSFAELWNGTKFRLLRPPGGGLNTVSCLSTSFCLTLTGSAAEIWTGKGWRTTSTFRGSFGFGPGLVALSCVRTSACMAVGNYLGSGGPQLIEGFNVAEWWNGSSWRRLTTPAGAGGGLADVSCTSPTRCMAAGLAPAGQLGEHTLAEQWNGSSWRLLATPNP